MLTENQINKLSRFTAEDIKQASTACAERIAKEAGKSFPTAYRKMLLEAIPAAFEEGVLWAIKKF